MRQLVSALTRKSLADVARRKGHTILVVLSILIGIFGLTAINVTEDTIISAVAFSQNESTQPDISFSVQNIDPALASTLAVVPNVQTVQIQTTYNTSWHLAPGGQVDLNIIGYQNPQDVTLGGFQLRSGRYPGRGEIILESGESTQQQFAPGDHIIVDTPQGNARLRIVGTSRTIGLGSIASTGVVHGYMSIDALTHLTGTGSANDIEVKVRNTAQEGQTMHTVEDVLMANHVTVINAAPHYNNISSNTSATGLVNVLRVLVAMAVALASLVIINTLITLVAEQTQIIGTMKALGGTRSTILRSYLLTVSIYGVLGTGLGIGLGLPVGYELAAQSLSKLTLDMGPFMLSPVVLATSLAVGLGIPLLAAFVPVWVGTRITVREAMGAYGVSAGSTGGRLQRVLRHSLRWIPQRFWLGLHGLSRRRGRTMLTLLALTLSGVTFLAVAMATSSINTKITNVNAYYDYDLRVEESKPELWQELRTEVLAVPNVQRVERMDYTDAATKWGHVHFTGIDADTKIYHPTLLTGHWFAPNERNVMLVSDDLASTAGLQVGDTLSFSLFGHTNSVTWKIIGIVHDPNADVGENGVVVTTSDNFNLITGKPVNSAEFLMVRAHDRSATAIGQLQTQVSTILSHSGEKIYVSTEQSQIQQTQQQFLPLYVMLYSATFVVILVGILGLYNTLITSVLERRREIGIWRAMGASSGHVVQVFWIEAVALAAITWIGSAAVGIPVAFGFLQVLNQWLLFNVSFVFDPAALGVMLAVILVTSMLACFVPAWSVSRMSLAEILHYE